jgi:hypothetical protein
MTSRGVWGFIRLDHVVSEVTRLICMEIVAVVAVPSACAPGDTAVQGVRDEPDLPGCAEFLVERGQGVLGGGHRKPRCRSASSMACRKPSAVTERTTRGGVDCGRRAYTRPASTAGQACQPG